MKRFLSMLVVLCMILAAIPMSVSAAGTVKNVTTFAELKSAITTQESGEGVSNPTRIIIKADITVTEELYLDYRNKVLLSDGDHTIARGNGYTGNMFKIKSNGSLDIGGVDGYGVLTFDGGALTDPSSSNAMFFYDGDNIVSNIYSGIFQNVRSNEGQGVFRLNYGNTTLNIGSVTFKDLSTVGAGGAMFIGNRAVVTIDGATFTNCVSNGDAGAIEAVNQYGATPTIVVNDGLFENCTAGASGGAIYQKDGSNLTVNGGIFRNCTATGVGGAISSWWLPSTVTINGGEFINCTGTNYGGAVHNMNGILNINGGKFDSNTNIAVFSEGGDGTLTLLGGNFTNNNYSVNHKCKSFDIGGTVKMDAGSLIRLDGSNKINIISNLTTPGAVANIEMKGDGTAILTGTTPELLANNYMKFGMKYGDDTCGVDSIGAVNHTIATPEFLPFGEPPVNTITLNFSGTTASAVANYGLGNAVLIVASYDIDGNLVNAAKYDVSLAKDTQVSKDVGTEFLNGSSNVKVFLWDGLSNIKPLVECLNK